MILILWQPVYKPHAKFNFPEKSLSFPKKNEIN